MFDNKIQSLSLENFTCFEQAQFNFSSGINVLIGENGTGKTHVLKVLKLISENDYSNWLTIDALKLFQIPQKTKTSIVQFNISKLLHSQKEHKITISSSTSKIKKILLNWDSSGISTTPFITKISKGLFLPTKEMLSWYEGFIAAYENRESSIDVTYYWLAKALAPLPLRGQKLEKAEVLLTELEKAINGRVIQKDGKFYILFNEEDKAIESNMIAEGINKVAQLIYLIQNGSLSKDTILFWDEPEANLNPKYISVITKFLKVLANHGVQIFIATHDYLLTSQLSLLSEYKNIEKAPDVKFFSLTKTPNGTQIEEGDTLADIQHNPILAEYAALYDREDELSKKIMK